jgi:hypothetical protein
MMKDTYYFSHDNNARRDPKIIALMDKYSAEGYGVYFMLIEILSEQHSYKIEKFPKLVSVFAREMFIKADRLEEILAYIINECELLKQDERFIWSESLMRRKEHQEVKRKARVEAGRIGGIHSGISRGDLKQNEAERSKTKQNEAALHQTNQSKLNESIVKEIIKKELKDCYVTICYIK